MNLHRRTNVLDVVRAVTEVAPHYPSVAVWWYVPRLLHDPKIELLVEVDPGDDVDLDRAASELASHLQQASVEVKRHGSGETRRLFKVVSRTSQQVEPGPR